MTDPLVLAGMAYVVVGSLVILFRCLGAAWRGK